MLKMCFGNLKYISYEEKIRFTKCKNHKMYDFKMLQFDNAHIFDF
jgi:hypothetical protein